jgi:hypothetical protein
MERLRKVQSTRDLENAADVTLITAAVPPSKAASEAIREAK